jgi:anti-sigma regulatory factor (Ser/Thr protein kinase)
MNAMAPTRRSELLQRRARLTPGPAAAAQARAQVRTAIRSWEVPVDPDVAVLLVSELVTNAITHQEGGPVTVVITCSGGRLRVDVLDTSSALPVVADVPADAETGRGLLLVDSLSDEWGFHLTPAGKAVYFTLAFQPGVHPPGDGRDPRGDGEPCPLPRLPVPRRTQQSGRK